MPKKNRFADFAHEDLKTAQELVRRCSDGGFWRRSAVSRAYYAAYNAALAVLPPEPEQQDNDARRDRREGWTHKLVPEALKRRQGRHVGALFDDLREARMQADYYHRFECTDHRVSEALTKAGAVLARLVPPS